MEKKWISINTGGNCMVDCLDLGKYVLGLNEDCLILYKKENEKDDEIDAICNEKELSFHSLYFEQHMETNAKNIINFMFEIQELIK